MRRIDPLSLPLVANKVLDSPSLQAILPLTLPNIDINCTLPTLPDPLFHLLEFYIHNDAPLSCRVGSVPINYNSLKPQDYTHMQFALTGTLQLSHLHINPNLNVIMHTTTVAPLPPTSSSPSSPSSTFAPEAEGAILAGTAYSLPATAASPRLVIGDPLPLRLSVRWYSSRTLPPSTSKVKAGVTGMGGHVHLSTVFYCLLSAGAGVAVSLAYWRGVELPRRMRRYGIERIGGGERGGYAWPASAANMGFGAGTRD
jgi:hypothetical protein